MALVTVVEAPAWVEPLAVAGRVWRGQAVAVVGYGWGANRPTFAIGTVAALDEPALDRWFGETAHGRQAPQIHFLMQSWQGTSGGPAGCARFSDVFHFSSRRERYAS